MLYYLDSAIVIYSVEGAAADQSRALTRLESLEQMGHRFAISDLTRAECLVAPLDAGSGERFLRFVEFFQGPNVRVAPMGAAVYDRAAAIRGTDSYASASTTSPPRRYGLVDSLHLAAAIEAGCDVFLTNDSRLAGFTAIAIELLS